MVNIKSALVLLILFFIAIVLPQSQKLFLADEIDYVKGAYAIVTTGLPVYTSDANNIQVALWHPPLYIYVLSQSFKFFGFSELGARLASILFSLGTLAVVYLLAKEVSDRSIVVFLSCFLFLLNPFVIQNSLLLDIDNTVLTFLISLFVYAYVRFIKTKEQTMFSLIGIGVLFGITLWAKFGTPPVLIVSIFIYHLARKEFRMALYRSSIIGITGIIFFVTTWLTYSLSLKLPYLMPFEHNIGYLPTSVGNSMVFLTKHLWGLKNIIFWVTPFFVILVLIVLIEVYHKKELKVIDYLLINGILIFIEYVIVGSQQAMDFPKYFAPMMPVLSVVLADFVEKQNFNVNKNIKLIIFVTALVFIYYTVVLKDPFLSERIIFISGSFYEIARETASTAFLYILPVFVSLIVLYKYYNLKRGLILGTLLCLVTFSIYIGIVQSTANYATNYLYGQEGIEETVNYTHNLIGPNDSIITQKDIAYYTKPKNWYYLPKDSNNFLNLTSRENISYIILSKEGYYTTEEYSKVMQIMRDKYILNAHFGDFKIYKIKEGLS